MRTILGREARPLQRLVGWLDWFSLLFVFQSAISLKMPSYARREANVRFAIQAPYPNIPVELWPYLVMVIKEILDIQSAEVPKASLSYHLTRDFLVETGCA